MPLLRTQTSQWPYKNVFTSLNCCKIFKPYINCLLIQMDKQAHQLSSWTKVLTKKLTVTEQIKTFSAFSETMNLMFVDPCIIVSVHTEKSNKMQQCIKIYYSIFIWSSTCFRRHTAYHQGPKTALAASGFAYMEGWWTCGCWSLSVSSNHMSNNLPHMQNQRLLVQF
jgi:hypothetical protein